MAADRERLIGFGGAVLIHLVLIGLLAFGVTRQPETPDSTAASPVIQATAVSEQDVMEPMRRREAEEEFRQRRLEEEQRQADEAQRRAEEAKRQAAEQARLAELKKREAEKARLAEQERQRKLEAEKRRKAEEARKKAEAERKAAEERKRAEAEAERKRQEAEQRLKEQLEAEKQRLAEEQQRFRQQQLLSVRQQYVADIRNKVERNWLRPTGSQGSHCRVVIHQIPGGEVVDVRLAECDGDVAFQRSVEAAVRKASPLPKPSDPDVFEREIEFVFEP